MFHRLISCQSVWGSSEKITRIVKRMIGKDVDPIELITLSFTCPKQSTQKISIWFAVKALHMTFRTSHSNMKDLWSEILAEILDEIQVNLCNNLVIGSKNEMILLQNVLQHSR